MTTDCPHCGPSCHVEIPSEDTYRVVLCPDGTHSVFGPDPGGDMQKVADHVNACDYESHIYRKFRRGTLILERMIS